MKQMRCAVAVVLAFLFLSIPAMGAGPFIEYQDVPVWDSANARMCILRTTWITYPDGSSETFEQLIC